MLTTITSTIWRIVSLTWLTGPIFDKELRVSSRRRRNYVIRSLYLLLLTVFITFVWIAQVNYGSSYSLYRASRMSEAGRAIIMCIVWFQFITTQIIAGVMLSSAISDEIYNKTLGVLMTTPINSFQIVTGKLCSKLLQTTILLAITLPILAVVRVFGGVPWGYLLASLAITLTTIIFIGSLSMFYSIFTKRAYLVIILTVITLVTIYGLIPLLAALIGGPLGRRGSELALFYANPYFALGMTTDQMMSARRGAGMTGFYWYYHCAIVMALAVALLAACIAMVRKAAVAQATGQTFSLIPRRRRKTASARAKPPGRIRRVKGNAILWKETRFNIFRHASIIPTIIFTIAFIVTLITYALVANADNLDEEAVHMTYCVIYMLLGMLFTVVIPATSITAEKEARSWPLLLATTLTDRQILLGKIAGAIRRILPAWIPLFAHLTFFSLAGLIHPVAILQIALITAAIIILFAGSGIFFSTCFKRTTTAVVMNFVLAISLWALLPFLMTMCIFASGPSGGGEELIQFYANTNPFVQIVLVLEATASSRMPLDYDWLKFDLNIHGSTLWLMLCVFFSAVPALIFAALAKQMFRTRVFHNA